MIKQPVLLRFYALFGGIIAAIFLAVAVPTHVHADTTSTAQIGLSMADDAALSISDVPNIDFGSQKVSATDTDVHAETISAPVTVTNPGFENGWTLTVAASNFSNSDKTRTIKGAKMTFDQATVTAQDAANVSVAPTSTSATIVAGGDAQPIISAAKNAGIGTYNAQYQATQVHLHVPSGNVEASYSADLNWSMTNSVE
jgi:spore coat protein U-like protein